MSRRHQCCEQLLPLMDQQIGKIEQANRYLESIKDAIAQSELNSLAQALSSPDLPVAEIEGIERQRDQLLADFGFTSDHQGFKECVSWCNDGRVTAQFGQLKESLTGLQHSLQINSLLINKNRNRVQRSIEILSGHRHSSHYQAYNSNGKADQSPGRRNIAIA